MCQSWPPLQTSVDSQQDISEFTHMLLEWLEDAFELGQPTSAIQGGDGDDDDDDDCSSSSPGRDHAAAADDVVVVTTGQTDIDVDVDESKVNDDDDQDDEARKKEKMELGEGEEEEEEEGRDKTDGAGGGGGEGEKEEENGEKTDESKDVGGESTTTTKTRMTTTATSLNRDQKSTSSTSSSSKKRLVLGDGGGGGGDDALRGGGDNKLIVNKNPMVELFYGQYETDGTIEGKVFANSETFGQFPLRVDGSSDLHESLEVATAPGDIETSGGGGGGHGGVGHGGGGVDARHQQQQQLPRPPLNGPLPPMPSTPGGPRVAGGQEQWFLSLPPVIVYELSRFHFNQELGQPEKIHNRLTFPRQIFMVTTCVRERESVRESERLLFFFYMRGFFF